MKKLMFSAVAVGLAGLCGAVESDIVGYRNSELADATEGGGFKMIAPSFKTISQEGFWLSQLTPQGYENNEDLVYAEGTMGDFNIQMLSAAGQITGTYLWARSNPDMDPEAWADDGHWVAPGAKEITTGDENDVLVKPGRGLYFSAPGNAGDEGTLYPLMMAGKVDMATVPVKFLDDGGFQCLGNPYPVSVMLSSLIPQGYENNEDLVYGEGTMGDFNIQMLSPAGQITGTYLWARSNPDMDPEAWADDGHWVAPGAKPIIYNPSTGKYDNDLEITAGMGVYFSSPGHAGDEGNDYTMQINYPAN